MSAKSIESQYIRLKAEYEKEHGYVSFTAAEHLYSVAEFNDLVRNSKPTKKEIKDGTQDC